MPQPSQSYATHRKFVPWWHFFAPVVLLANLVSALWKLGRAVTSDATPVTFDGVLAVLVAVALLVVWFYSRIFPLAVQDRVIRQEMRLRLARVLPDDLKGRIDQLDRGQIIALRFASDAELPDLTRKALDEGTDRETLKKQIKDWQADHWRC
jgi:Family of unknown function (DUF6526)